MKKFEIGKRYTNGEEFGRKIEIEVLKRTDKTVTFKYLNRNIYGEAGEILRKKVDRCLLEFESLRLGKHWSDDSVYAKYPVA